MTGELRAMDLGEGFPAADDPRLWIIVVCRQNLEVKARSELARQGFDVYLPMRLFEHPRTRELRSTPFFPRYLFARVSPRVEQWRAIFSTYGVSSVLGCTSTKVIGLKDQVVETIRQREEDGYIKLGLQREARFQRGDRVRVPMAARKGWEFEVEAAFEEYVDHKRALILLSWLGRDSRCVVSVAKLSRSREH